ncbi:MAG: hypothetical protein Q9213_001630 [Squamulea squamosa]
MAEALFRFCVLRPAVKVDPLAPYIGLETDSPFQNGLLSHGANSLDPLDAYTKYSWQYVGGAPQGYIRDPTANSLAAKILQFGRLVDALENIGGAQTLDPSTVTTSFKSVFNNQEASVVTASEDFKSLQTDLRDSLVAIKFTRDGPTEDLVTVLRDSELAARMVVVLSKQAWPTRNIEFYKYRRRLLRLPSKLALSQQVPQPASAKIRTPDPKIAIKQQCTHEFIEKLSGLRKAISELSIMTPDSLCLPEVNYNPNTIMRQEKILTADAIQSLSDTTTSVLTATKLDPRRLGFTSLITESQDHILFRREGPANVLVKTRERPEFVTQALYGHHPTAIDQPPIQADTVSQPAPQSTPQSAVSIPAAIPGKLVSIGVADLVVVRQQLKEYETTDISHIENVLKGETKTTEYTNTRKLEEILINESEVTTTEEDELTSTSRYELSTEVKATLKEDSSIKASLSAKYGGIVEISASAEGSLSREKTTANSTATKFSRDITERSAKKIAERVLQRSTVTLTNETIEKNTRGFNNTSGTDNVSGVYTYLNKVYEAQCWKLGMRAMYDFMVPEPASFLIEAMAKNAQDATVLEAPGKFDMKPGDILEDNWQALSAQYGTSDVGPPPSPYVWEGTKITIANYENDQEGRNAGDILSLPTGYQASRGIITLLKMQEDHHLSLSIAVGGQGHFFVEYEGSTNA